MTEAQEQEALIQRAQYHPITRELLYAIPNDGIRTPVQGARFKRRGLKPGMPDVCLPYPSNGFHALYIELKTKTGRPTQSQLKCLESLRKAGNAAYIARGWQEAWEIITNYLTPKTMSINFKIEHTMQITSVTLSGSAWQITMHGTGWPWMMKPPKVKCPACHGTRLHVKENYIKGGKRYTCLNDNCKTETFIIK